MGKVGRPGAGRKAHGAIRAQILPALKVELEHLVQTDPRWRSLSHVVETAVGFFMAQLQASQGRVDQNNHPEIATHPVPRATSPPKKAGNDFPR